MAIPNKADALIRSQSKLDSGDVQVLEDAIAGTAIITGCTVTAGTGLQTVVAAGAYRIRSTEPAQVVATATNVSHDAADPTNPRVDLVVGDNAESISAVKGVASSNPLFPTIPADSIVFAVVTIPVDLTQVLAGHIYSKSPLERVDLKHPLVRPASHAENWGVPGWYSQSANEAAPGAGILWHVPFYVSETHTFIEIGLHTVIASVGLFSKGGRAGIYEWKDDTAPGALILDAGFIATDGTPTGSKSIVISQELHRGFYYLSYVQDDIGGTFKGVDAARAIAPPVSGAFSQNFGAGQSREIIVGTVSRGADVLGGLPDPAPVTDIIADPWRGSFLALRYD